MSDIELLQRRFQRERAARKEAESLLEKKSLEVYQANEELKGLANRLRKQAEHTQAIVDTAAEGIITYDQAGLIKSFNRSAQRIFRCKSALDCHVSLLFDLNDENREVLFPAGPSLELLEPVDINVDETDLRDPVEILGRRASRKSFFAEVAVSAINHDDQILYTALVRDLTRRRKLEARLSQAQKMESVGQLAAGIAHEINTPIQFIGDNVQFLEGAFDDLGELLDLYQQLQTAVAGKQPTDELLTTIAEREEIADLAFLREEFPDAIQQTMEGIGRVSKIVRAMKEFSQPASEARSLLDLNKAINNTLAIIANQARDVAEIETSLDPRLTPMPCLVSQMNQTLLNILSNAVEALADHGSEGPGKIWISTHRDCDAVEFCIRDNGPGIPLEIQSRIFDPFFTTKEVGKGMGQGLAFVYDVVVDKHDGSIHVQSALGEGTAFTIRLPLAQKEDSKEVEDEHANSVG